jgi:sugar lactone lactonase YvrE
MSNTPIADEPKLPTAGAIGRIETMATFDGPMPTGVTVSRKGRIFVNFPRWGDPVEFTVAELKDRKPVAYPDAAWNRLNTDRPAECLVSAQSVVVDSDDRLWLLDTGHIEFGRPLPGGPKLVGVDLRTNTVFQTIRFPRDVALDTTYLNDVRFDLCRSEAGVAYITDSSENGLIVVDLATKQSRRRLHGLKFKSTQPEPQFLPIVEGQPLMIRPRGGPPSYTRVGANGIAISRNGKFLYYCPMSSRHLYRVRTDTLMGEQTGDEEGAQAEKDLVEDLGDRGFASDGLETDDMGRLYLTNYEDNAILRRHEDGSYETLVYDPRVLWPDTLCLAADGYLYFIANQLHRQGLFQGGKDLRQKPYSLFRVKVDAGPVLLRREQ